MEKFGFSCRMSQYISTPKSIYGYNRMNKCANMSIFKE